MKDLKDWTLGEIKQECYKAEKCTESCRLAYVNGHGNISCRIDDMMGYDEAPYMWELERRELE